MNIVFLRARWFCRHRQADFNFWL